MKRSTGRVRGYRHKKERRKNNPPAGIAPTYNYKREEERMQGTVSFPFRSGEHERIAVKVIDFRGE